MIVKIVSYAGYAKAASPWMTLPDEIRKRISSGVSNDAEIANSLAEEGWELVAVIPVAGPGIYDKELWLQKS